VIREVNTVLARGTFGSGLSMKKNVVTVIVTGKADLERLATIFEQSVLHLEDLNAPSKARELRTAAQNARTHKSVRLVIPGDLWAAHRRQEGAA
jgi:hypothetical protein